MLDAAFGLNGSVGLFFKKQIEVSYYDSKFKRAICAGAFQRDQKPSSSSWR